MLLNVLASVCCTAAVVVKFLLLRVVSDMASVRMLCAWARSSLVDAMTSLPLPAVHGFCFTVLIIKSLNKIVHRDTSDLFLYLRSSIEANATRDAYTDIHNGPIVLNIVDCVGLAQYIADRPDIRRHTHTVGLLSCESVKEVPLYGNNLMSS